jgi:hypothetical protein
MRPFARGQGSFRPRMPLGIFPRGPNPDPRYNFGSRMGMPPSRFPMEQYGPTHSPAYTQMHQRPAPRPLLDLNFGPTTYGPRYGLRQPRSSSFGFTKKEPRHPAPSEQDQKPSAQGKQQQKEPWRSTPAAGSKTPATPTATPASAPKASR